MNKKHTDEQKNEVIRLYKEGRTYKEIIAQMGLHPRLLTISFVPPRLKGE